jgi:Zn-dependent protease with chaperone function
MPEWIDRITDNKLRAAFSAVWQRMPAYVQPAMEIDSPAVFVVDKLPPPAGDELARTRVGVYGETRQAVLHMLFTREALALPEPALMGLIAHELAHVYLRHFDNILSKTHRHAPPEVVAWQEWHATFCARRLFGFQNEIGAWREVQP